MSYAHQLASVSAHLDICREREALAAILPDTVMDMDLWLAILGEAARFAEDVLAPINSVVDTEGCGLKDGRVCLPATQREAWAAFAANGWMSLTVPEAYGGQGLPMLLLAAVHEFFERGCVAFCMIPGGTRAASRLLEAHADDVTRAQWLPKLATGTWTATICISEAGAGSDVGRIRTRAVPMADGTWRITGEKMWISFGDHDAAERIGHLVLARSEADTPGVKGLSLFLVSSIRDENNSGIRNGVACSRIEHKIGLHGSPTCTLVFDEAHGMLIGERGRGLQQLFRMITAMRLSVGVQGVGIAAGAHAVAVGYAAQRLQGGGDAQSAEPIDRHADVSLSIVGISAALETHRGMTLAASALADIADLHPEKNERERAGLLLQWLLPLVKTGGGELAFGSADAAIQILGGAGITREWPVEQALRDARALTIYEGTTGIQAIDLLRRRVLGTQPGFEAFAQTVRAELGNSDGPMAEVLHRSVDRMATVVTWMRNPERSEGDRDCGATAFLHLAILVARGWIAWRLAHSADDGMRAAGRHWLTLLEPRVIHQASLATIGERAAFG